MQIIEDEADDVEHEMKMLKDSHWDQKYAEHMKTLHDSKAGQELGRRAHTFGESEEAKMIGKELHDLGVALKTHVKITDVPKEMQEDIAMLKLHCSKKGQLAIEKELADVGHTMKAIKMTRSVRNLKNSFEKFFLSKEWGTFEKFDAKFWASPAGKELHLEIMDLHDSLKSHVKPTKDGIHIDKEGMDIIGDEMDDVEHEYKMLHGSKWEKGYAAHMKALAESKSGKQLGRRMDTFGKSAEWKKLEKELKELETALATHVKVTDLPEDMYLF